MQFSPYKFTYTYVLVDKKLQIILIVTNFKMVNILFY